MQTDYMEIEFSTHMREIQNANISHITGHIIDTAAINVLIYN